MNNPDVADIIAGALQTSRAHAYELMSEALAEQLREPRDDGAVFDPRGVREKTLAARAKKENKNA